MGKRKKKTIAVVAAAVCLAAAAVTATMIYGPGENETVSEENETVSVPQFNAGNAYESIVRQCAFGPRVAGTDSHAKCADYIATEFEKAGYKVLRQKATLRRYDGASLESVNIFATGDTVSARRILLSAHWDSRPWADHDPDASNHKKPVPGANDGASGVAVMLEIARVIRQHPPKVAVDFVCFDAEDSGTPEWDKREGVSDDGNTWCLGSQHFAANLPRQGYMPMYAVNLDMVGGKAARFLHEGFSKRYAPGVVDKVWNAAYDAGYSSAFPNQDGGYVTDDHLPLNQIAGIPAINIIPCYSGYPNSFGPTWHTLDDNPDNIDTNTLKAVGQTVLQLIYNEK